MCRRVTVRKGSVVRKRDGGVRLVSGLACAMVAALSVAVWAGKPKPRPLEDVILPENLFCEKVICPKVANGEMSQLWAALVYACWCASPEPGPIGGLAPIKPVPCH